MNNPVPLISSETSSAVSDRAVYANDPATGHVRGYDTEHPSWGQTAEGAWGGTLLRDSKSSAGVSDIFLYHTLVH